MQRRRRMEWEYGSLAQSLLQPKSTVLHVCCRRWPLQVCKEFLLMRRRNGMCIVWGKTWVKKKKDTEKCTESHPIYICLSILHLWNVRRGTCIMGSHACTYMHCNIHTTSLPLRISKESVFPGWQRFPSKTMWGSVVLGLPLHWFFMVPFAFFYGDHHYCSYWHRFS